MKKTILVLILALSCKVSLAQWKQILSLPNYEYVTYVYFLDLPGPPQVGFAGTTVNLYKTIDGGKKWYAVCNSGVNDIYFKDSLTGWVTTDLGSFYQTTDGGETWVALNAPGTDPIGVYYSNVSNKLFLLDSMVRYSPDLGNIWGSWTNFYPISLSYWSDSVFVIAGTVPEINTPEKGDTDRLFREFETLDGGITWDTINPQYYGGGIYPIVGTSSSYSTYNYYNYYTGNTIQIYRSDDFDRSWYLVANISTNQISTGVIEGDFSWLTMQTDSGMYGSIDSGVTWNFIGGPPYNTQLSNDIFYSAKGVTIAGMSYTDGGFEGKGLWEETWPFSGVKEQEPTSSGILIFWPSIASSSVNITLDQTQTESNFMLCDEIGREVFSRSIMPGIDQIEVPVSNLPNGIYFGRINSNPGVESTQLIVKH